MKKVVCDTGPMLHLKEAGLLNLLPKTGKIFIPMRVDAELARINLSWKNQKPSWIFIEKLSPEESSKAKVLRNWGLLDIGEAESIILARRLKVKWLLTDDTAARVFANVIGLEVHGSLGVILWTAVVGYLQGLSLKKEPKLWWS